MCGPCCPGKPNTKRLRIGAQEVGIAGFDEIMAKGLEHLDDSDKNQRDVILKELKNQNYVPESAEKDYLDAVWAEFKQIRAKKLGQLEERYHGIPCEEIQWSRRSTTNSARTAVPASSSAIGASSRSMIDLT